MTQPPETSGRPRDPQNFTRGDRTAVTIFVSIGLAVTVGLLALFVFAIVLPGQQ